MVEDAHGCRVLIAGSCVSGDILNYRQQIQPFNKIEYHARSSLCTLGNKRKLSELFENEILKNPSLFQRRMVCYDLDMQLLDSIQNIKFDILLMDLIDERFNLSVLGENEIATCSEEFVKTSIVSKSKIDRYSDEFFELWKKGAQILFSQLELENNLHKVIVQKAYWTDTLSTGEVLERYSTGWAERENAKLQKMYDFMAQYLREDQFVTFPEDLLLINPDHRWGVAPFHYIDEYYIYLIDAMKLKIFDADY